VSGMVCFCAHKAVSRDFAMLGQVPKWTKGADCKSVAIGFQGSNPCLPTIETNAEWRVLSAESRRRRAASLLSTEDSVFRTQSRQSARA
jgi:hypothetical protein